MNDLLLVEYSGFCRDYKSFFSSSDLTKRESEITYLINKGYKNKVIGELLYISETTVKKHVYNIFNKLQINSRFELICVLRDNTHITSINRAC